jgi:hypothetical protein
VADPLLARFTAFSRSEKYQVRKSLAVLREIMDCADAKTETRLHAAESLLPRAHPDSAHHKAAVAFIATVKARYDA